MKPWAFALLSSLLIGALAYQYHPPGSRSRSIASLRDSLAGSLGQDFVVVIDAGSTGTRLYKIGFGSTAGVCAAPFQKEVLGEGAPLADSDDETLKRILGEFALKHPEIAEAEIRAVGTGGFRRLDVGLAEVCGNACQAKLQRIRDTNPFKHGGFQVVKGEDEGRLSWLSVATLRGNRRVAILEIGGATVQLTYPEGSGLRTKMAAIGANTLLSQAPDCRLPAKYEACLAAVAAVLKDNEDARNLLQSSQDTAGLPVIGLGRAFNATSRSLAMSEGFSRNIHRLEELGESICSEPGNQFPHICAELALQTLLFRRFDVDRVENVSIEIGAAIDDIEGMGRPRSIRCKPLNPS